VIQPQVLTAVGLQHALHVTLCYLAPSLNISLLKPLSSLHLLKLVSRQLVCLSPFTQIPDMLLVLSAYKKTFLNTMHCQRTVELVPTTESHFEACFLSETDLSLLPMLAEVPTDFWAKSKYDVGLIKR